MSKKAFHWPGQRTDDPGHAVLASFLVMDIQHNREWAQELLDRIEEVKSGKIPMWERIGNAYQVEIGGEGAIIEDLVDEQHMAQLVSLKDLSTAAEAWLAEII